MAKELKSFYKLVDLALCAHNTSRSHPDAGSCSDIGSFINENTLIRVDEALETIRCCLPKDQQNWLNDEKATGFPAYIIMRIYRNSIMHHNGTLNHQFFQDNSPNGKCEHGFYIPGTIPHRKVWYTYYKQFCQEVDVKPLECGQKLMLSVREPDFLTKLLEGVLNFAKHKLG